MDKRSFGAGEQIIKEGSIDFTAYLILQGNVQITKNIKGQQVVLGTLGRNEIFGELALFDNKPRSATVTAVEATECVVIKKELLQKETDKMDEWAQRMFKVLANRLRTANVNINPISDEDYYYTVSSMLYNFFSTFGKKRNENFLSVFYQEFMSYIKNALNISDFLFEEIISKLCDFKFVTQDKDEKNDKFINTQNKNELWNFCTYFIKVKKQKNDELSEDEKLTISEIEVFLIFLKELMIAYKALNKTEPVYLVKYAELRKRLKLQKISEERIDSLKKDLLKFNIGTLQDAMGEIYEINVKAVTDLFKKLSAHKKIHLLTTSILSRGR